MLYNYRNIKEMRMQLPVNYDNTKPAKRRKVREAYVELQDGKCYHCKEPLTGKPSIEVGNMWVNSDLFPKGFFRWPVHLHHSHDTGMTIGAVHSKCNAVLWQYHGE